MKEETETQASLLPNPMDLRQKDGKPLYLMLNKAAWRYSSLAVWRTFVPLSSSTENCVLLGVKLEGEEVGSYSYIK